MDNGWFSIVMLVKAIKTHGQFVILWFNGDLMGLYPVMSTEIANWKPWPSRNRGFMHQKWWCPMVFVKAYQRVGLSAKLSGGAGCSRLVKKQGFWWLVLLRLTGKSIEQDFDPLLYLSLLSGLRRSFHWNLHYPSLAVQLAFRMTLTAWQFFKVWNQADTNSGETTMCTTVLLFFYMCIYQKWSESGPYLRVFLCPQYQVLPQKTGCSNYGIKSLLWTCGAID